MELLNGSGKNKQMDMPFWASVLHTYPTKLHQKFYVLSTSVLVDTEILKVK